MQGEDQRALRVRRLRSQIDLMSRRREHWHPRLGRSLRPSGNRHIRGARRDHRERRGFDRAAAIRGGRWQSRRRRQCYRLHSPKQNGSSPSSLPIGLRSTIRSSVRRTGQSTSKDFAKPASDEAKRQSLPIPNEQRSLNECRRPLSIASRGFFFQPVRLG
jgi:hypothetical protein